jgi:hypothetical protein
MLMKLNLVLDTRLFDGKWLMAYYDKTTTNDIVNVSASETSGYGVQWRTWEKLPTVVLKCLFRVSN